MASNRIRIGNQTAFSAADPMAPFRFAVDKGFDAFEWFADKKQNEDGSWSGWDVADMDAAERAEVKRTGEAKDILYTVHAPWQANPLMPGTEILLRESVDFARDIGATLVNLHLYLEEGPRVFVERLAPVVSYAAEVGVRIAIENTPLTTPADFRQFFASLRETEPAANTVGMCLDLGHANLCEPTRNDYIRYVDELGAEVPIIHVHLHENYGDADSHLPLFTGPARDHDGGIRELARRLKDRRYDGALILEVWPEQPELLAKAEARLRPMLGSAGRKHRKDRQSKSRERREKGKADGGPPARKPRASARPQRRTVERIVPAADASSEIPLPNYPAHDDAFTRAVVEASERHRSWRERLGWVHETLTHTSFDPRPENLATLAVYLRFLGTGEVQCEEDGRHFRPNHHARAAEEIEGALTEIQSPDSAWVLRKIYPWLPSFADDFRRREPLTRIRDIAHRNDIPQDLKREIKHRLQNKLHRCAGPEDFQTSEEILERITAPGADYSPDFVHQFEIFHEELGEFFNAAVVEQRLVGIAPLLAPEDAALVKGFVTLKGKAHRSTAELLQLLDVLTALRAGIDDRLGEARGADAQRMRMTDIGLEDYAFALLSDLANRLEAEARLGPWTDLLHALIVAIANVRLSRIESEECAVLAAELRVWSKDFDRGNRLHLLRLKATLERARRLTETYADQALSLFPGRVTGLGRALGVAPHAIAVFCEGDIRGNVVFQLSKLVEILRSGLRVALGLAPWETVVPGDARGRLLAAADLESLAGRSIEAEPLVVLLDKAEGDEEIPTGVVGILLGHTIPHLSHLGVRARQAGIAFAAADDREAFEALAGQAGTLAHLAVGADDLKLEEADRADAAQGPAAVPPPAVAVPDVVESREVALIPVADARPETCGAKVAGAGTLAQVAGKSPGLFHAPRSFALPFGAMMRCLEKDPPGLSEYRSLVARVNETPVGELDTVLQRLRDRVMEVAIPQALLLAVRDAFDADTGLAVRSSANGEDLEHLAGAGLYDSVVGAKPGDIAEAIRTVWASIWTRRATLSRSQAGIAHEAMHMGVLIQEMVAPELCFVMHTVDPATKHPDIAYVELAAGLGETLASAAQPGTPYRLRCERRSGHAELTNCASFSFALRPGAAGALEKERLDYGRVSLSTDNTAAASLGQRLGAIANLLEDNLGVPQDAEGVLTQNGEIYLVQTRPQQGLQKQPSARK